MGALSKIKSLDTDVPITISIKDAIKKSGLSRSTLYKAMKSGDLPFCKIGRRRLLRTASLEQWLEGSEVGHV